MAGDSELAALLPEPPSPRPAQREIALAAAMRRFDGHEGPQGPAREAQPAPPRRWLHRPQVMSLATMAVVALLSTSVWLSQSERFAEPPEHAAPARAGLPTFGERAAAAPEDTASPASVAAEVTQEREAVLGGVEAGAALPVVSDQAAPAPAEEAIVVTGARVQGADFESNSPTVTVDEALLENSSSAAAGRARPRALIVNGSRIARPDRDAAASPAAERARPPAPDWNACTVLDPGRSVRACRRLADPTARGASGRAAAQLADGLTRAWDGDLDRAIADFDRAIASAPDLSIAYLNRGLAYQLKGDLARARADLDRAIAADPNAARGYYHRSQVRRAAGDAAGAEADARRQAQLEGRD